jgi:hypothetical protein
MLPEQLRALLFKTLFKFLELGKGLFNYFETCWVSTT